MRPGSSHQKCVRNNRHNLCVYAISLSFLLSAITMTSYAGADECTDCHSNLNVMPGITTDWEKSKHFQNNVTCKSCHLASPGDPGSISHGGFTITPIVTPNDCAICHSQQATEFQQSLHSLGAKYYEYLFNRGALPFLESQIEGGYIIIGGENVTHSATIRGCQACHGTNMTGKDTTDIDVWPNNGIGRINPDGSMGSCAACHTRHTFSVAEARHPETCGQCHMGPDHPQIEIFLESKHGNIYSSEGDSWNWTADDWVAGVDYRAPTCASCHMSGVPGVPATHDVGTRLSWELEPAVSRRTDNIANSLGVTIGDPNNPLSSDDKRDNMKDVCHQCHGDTWVDNFYEQADIVVELYNEQYAYVRALVQELYDDGLLTDEPFDEPIEFKVYEFWHHEGRRARMGAFMQGPDYVQWHGFYELLKDRVEIEEMADDIRRLASEAEAEEQLRLDVDFMLMALAVFILVELVIIAIILVRRGARAED